MSDNEQDFATEDQGEAAFYHFCYELSFYLKSGKWGPLIWKECDEETRLILKNIVKLDEIGCKDLENWSPP